MSFDPRDPYDAAALYDMWLNCSRCPATVSYTHLTLPTTPYV